jgi:hypothetical protein
MFEWKTSAIKFLSCACCVGAGLPVGPEGPMIFLGATLGGLVSQGTVNFSLMPPSKFRDTAELALSKTGGRLWPFKRFRNKCDQRDFMTAGCAAGVAGAFGAPIGASACWVPSVLRVPPLPHQRAVTRGAARRLRSLAQAACCSPWRRWRPSGTSRWAGRSSLRA